MYTREYNIDNFRFRGLQPRSTSIRYLWRAIKSLSTVLVMFWVVSIAWHMKVLVLVAAVVVTILIALANRV